MPHPDEPRAQAPAPAAAQPGAAADTSARTRAARRALRKKLATVALIAGLCLGVVMTRAVWEGTRALAAGDAAHEQGDPRAAITQWRRSARWYVPGGRHMGVAYDRLEHLAHQAEEQGDLDTALAAWRGIRGSILATRSLYTPFAERLEPANRHIAALMAELEARTRADDTPDEADRAAWHYDLLARSHGPSPFWSLVAILGFSLWLGGGLLFAWRGVTAEDELVPRTAAYAGLMVAGGLLAWMLGLHLA